MRNNNWEPETEYPNEPWNRGTYQTGSTQPPKSHGGLIAVLLALVIFLGGISSALGILNIRLFRQISNAEATAASSSARSLLSRARNSASHAA